MSFLRRLRHPVETFRSAPASFFGIGIGALLLSVSDYEASALEALGAAHGVAVMIGSTCLGIVQLQRQDRIEKSLENSDYDDRVMKPTAEHWCDRQSTIVLCERFDKANPEANTTEQYKQLCEGLGDTIKLHWLPHI